MNVIGVWTIIHLINSIVLFLCFLIILTILIQRGKGGGLIGALGGAGGGGSPFGSRAGDTFTRITLYMALIWILLIIIQVKFVQWEQSDLKGRTNPTSQVVDEPKIG